MASYDTTSGFDDLIGSIEVTGDDVTSYTSDIRGMGSVQNLGGPGLNFNVTFAQVARPYHVRATADPKGNGYTGTANNGGPTAGQESWTATASTGVPAEESSTDHPDSSAEDAATRKAAS